MRVNKAEKLRRRVHELAESMGNLFVETFHFNVTNIFTTGLCLQKTSQYHFMTL